MNTVVFNLENVDVAYKDLIALRQINLKITSGEKVALVGPSGAGKTTLLHKLYQLRAEDCAFVYQDYTLKPHRSAFHNIYLGRLARYSPLFNLLNFIKPQKRVLAEVLSILKSLGMEEILFKKAGQLSDDQQQRVAVGRAIYHSGRVILADEPIASMDHLKGDATLKLLVEMDKTIVMALHSVEMTLKYAHRVVGLCHGRIRFDLPVDQVTPDHITELYISC